jgi:hypothetical protein
VTSTDNSVVDRDRDVLVASFDVRVKIAHGRKRRIERGELWHVFLGSELIDHFEDRDDAIELARRVAVRSGRPAWISLDGIAFDSLGIDRM